MKSKIKIFVAIFLLLLVIFVGVIPRKKYELFATSAPLLNLNVPKALQGAQSTESVYYNSTSYQAFDNTVGSIFNTLIDYSTSFLMMKRCYAIPNLKIESLFPNGTTGGRDNYYMKRFGIYTNKFGEVEDKIYQTLLTFADNQPTKLINGDVYVMITQQPYYRNADGTPISLDISIINDRHNYNSPKNLNKGVIDAQPIYYQVYIIFGAYTADGTYDKCSDHFKNTMGVLDTYFYSRENQCFITTVDDISKFGGCATSAVTTASKMSKDAATTANTSPYDSMCLGPQFKDNNIPYYNKDYSKPKILPTTYLILYIINQNYNKVYNISALFDPNDKCKMVNNMPPTDPIVSSMMKYY